MSCALGSFIYIIYEFGRGIGNIRYTVDYGDFEPYDVWVDFNINSVTYIKGVEVTGSSTLAIFSLAMIGVFYQVR